MKRLVKVLLVTVVVIFGLMFINNYSDGRNEEENYVLVINDDGDDVMDYKPNYGQLVFESVKDTVQVIGALGEVAVHAASGVIEGL